MLKIFDLFLFLLALWILFMISAGKISWFYILFGIAASAFVSAISYRLKIIEKKSELLYLSLGFYRHFFKIFIRNFFSSIKLIIRMALASKSISPVLYTVKIDQKNKFNPALLMISYNMTAGLFCVGSRDGELLIHALDPEYSNKFNLPKTQKSLSSVNDDNLV